ncbi:hypothetical protein PE066_05650 [Ramlibacter tataouinensis]|uniref:hypothetical protein n=1 Tax=Ramlibacter tataouinensis TaxID=94132 RepID=UPI0022F3E47B|nr:hypothetical protein [Ramlibacter tataouinensis]WBY03021.1 hypothetical protein PE066_05650 [Ramlibacter tataouinensis]
MSAQAQGMEAAPNKDDALAALQRLGITVPAGDLPFLQRTLLRQRELRRELMERVPADTEPANVFRLPG